MDKVIIVGGGPAGASCAWRLAADGIPCMLLDRAVFPRRKVCGGALSHRAESLLVGSGMITEAELDGLTLVEHSGLSLWDGDDLLRRWSGPGPAIRLVDRLSFDGFLLNRAAAAGAEVRQGTRVSDADPARRRIALSSGEEIAFSSLVGADGAAGIVRRRLFPMSRGRGTGIGLEVFVPLDSMAAVPEELQIRFGILPYGYGWVFPGPEIVCIGAGVAASTAPAVMVRDALRELLSTLGVELDREQLMGAPIPSMALHRELGRGDVYLIGDAAGLCDQVSGEGMSHAVESGLLVGRAISCGWSRRRLSREAGRGCVGVVRQSIRLRHLIYHPAFREEAMFRLRREPKFAAAYWSLISGETDYMGMLSRILAGP